MNICQKCGHTSADEQKFCPNCGNQLSSTGAGQQAQSNDLAPTVGLFSAANQTGQAFANPPGNFSQHSFGQTSNFGGQNTVPPTRKSRKGLYIGLGVGALAIFMVGILAIGGGIYWYSQTKILLKDRLVEQVSGYKRGEIKTNVTEDLKKDSVEHFVATYTPSDSSSNRKNVTFVVIRYPSKERAEQAVQNKVKAMLEGTISNSKVVDAGAKTIKGKNVGQRTVLSSLALEQVVWNVNEDFLLVTSGLGSAVEFERSLPNQ